ncbi:hypothetical protein BP6252_10597 [Coleophoma cylindrospora]|uniref:Uncharacterized protein n=1 Tax=Coleophoma cylindrospora TaxID=1849047 RepID=A0A3D8QSY2_9HELO|nr:hypothetical protein BP6252_10597 [Coleophoma cylindrospora]
MSSSGLNRQVGKQLSIRNFLIPSKNSVDQAAGCGPAQEEVNIIQDIAENRNHGPSFSDNVEERIRCAVGAVMSEEVHHFGCRKVLKEFIHSCDQKTVTTRIVEFFDKGFIDLLKIDHELWSAAAHLHMQRIGALDSCQSGIYLDVIRIPKNSSFWTNEKVAHMPLPSAEHADIEIPYIGSTKRGFGQRIFKEHEDPVYRAKVPSWHYAAIDSDGAEHAYFLVANIPADEAEEIFWLAEAAAIALLNTNSKGGVAYVKVLQLAGVLPLSIQSPWGINRSNALMDFDPFGLGAGNGELSATERADIQVKRIVAAGGVDVPALEYISREQSAAGGTAAAYMKSTNILAQMIQTGRIMSKKSNLNIAGHKMPWGIPRAAKNIPKEAKAVRVWICFHDKPGPHPQAWLKGDSELSVFAWKATVDGSSNWDWMYPKAGDAVKTEIARRIVDLKWRRRLVGTETQKETRKRN